jgi:hypothetical protein
MIDDPEKLADALARCHESPVVRNHLAEAALQLLQRGDYREALRCDRVASRCDGQGRVDASDEGDTDSRRVREDHFFAVVSAQSWCSSSAIRACAAVSS